MPLNNNAQSESNPKTEVNVSNTWMEHGNFRSVRAIIEPVLRRYFIARMLIDAFSYTTPFTFYVPARQI